MSGLRRKTPLRRTRPLPKRGRGTRFRGYVRDAAYQEFVRRQGCACHPAFGHQHGFTGAKILTANPCEGPVEFAHIKSRGAGGKDHRNGIGLCRWHHDQQHRMGVTSFAAHHGMSLRATAERLWRDYQGER